MNNHFTDDQIQRRLTFFLDAGFDHATAYHMATYYDQATGLYFHTSVD